MDHSVYLQKWTKPFKFVGPLSIHKFNFNNQAKDTTKLTYGLKVVVIKIPTLNSILEAIPVLSRRFGMSKLHKLLMAMRITVSFVSTPTYKLDKV